MNFCCENCGWSEIVGSPIMCNYNGHRTWRDECCEAWKPKGKKTNMVKVVRCKDCKHGEKWNAVYACGKSRGFGTTHKPDWFCADGEREVKLE